MKGLTFFLLLISITTLYSQPITLRDTTNQYDYIIITVPEFVNACEPFKQHKETIRDFRTIIVDTTQIFAEFDSSATPQDNIRNFISFAGTFWKEPRPKFFLIIGRVADIPNFQIPDPYSVYCQSDFYYGNSIYENDSTTTDFLVGRIPCKSENELENYFSKVIDYESNTTLLPWMNNNLFICDDDIQFGFLEEAISLSEDYLPDFMRSYFISEDSNSVYYGNKDSIYNVVNERGNSIMWFEGHNSDTFAIRPDYFNLSDLAGLENADIPFLTIYVGRQSSIIDTNTNMTREMLVMNSAGSIGGIVFVGISYWGVTQTFQRHWAQRIFDPTIYSLGEAFTLDSLVPQAGVYWYMKQITNLWADPSLKLKYDITVGVEKSIENIPNGFLLFQNYPNPFNPTTVISYKLPVTSHVILKVYNVLGVEVATLVNEYKLTGSYEVEFNTISLPSGVYYYQLSAGSFIQTKKMIFIK